MPANVDAVRWTYSCASSTACFSRRSKIDSTGSSGLPHRAGQAQLGVPAARFLRGGVEIGVPAARFLRGEVEIGVAQALDVVAKCGGFLEIEVGGRRSHLLLQR